MPVVGYAHLCEALSLKVIAPKRVAMIKPVTKGSLDARWITQRRCAEVLFSCSIPSAM